MSVDKFFDEFLRFDNFELAWERVLRSQHADNKDRIALREFETGIEHNLKHIISEIETKIYTPSAAPKIYIPKSSLTLRTIPVLSVGDRILYQAMGNMIVKKALPDLSFMANRHVFAHIPQSGFSFFSVMPWRVQFQKFTQFYERIWNQGNKWVVEADIASFYASIDHNLLIDLIRDRWIDNDEFLDLFRMCIQKWTAHEQGPEFTKGIPEGYETSDILATLFLLPVDESMVRDFRYIRYVDDIRVLTPDKNTANQALVDLDIALQSRALILQTKKTGLEEVKDLEDEKANLRRKLSQINILKDKGIDQQNSLKQLFLNTCATDGSLKIDETALSFTLYRLRPDEEVRDIALKLFEFLPKRSHIINYYLRSFPSDNYVIQELIKILSEHKIYGWHLSNCMDTLSQITRPGDYRDIALSWVKDRNIKWFQRLAAVDALQRDEDSYTALFMSISHEENVIVKRALIVACAFLAEQAGSKGDLILIIEKALSDNRVEIKRLGIWLYNQFSNISWADIRHQGILGPLHALVPELAHQQGEAPCYIKHTFRNLYKIKVGEVIDFKQIFADYPGTVGELRKAVSYYRTDPSLYVGLINSFNHRVAIALQTLYGQNIPQDQYGNMLNFLQDKVQQTVFYFRMCNETRNQTAGFHPFAKRSSTWAEEVTYSKRDTIHDGLKTAYREFIEVIIWSHRQQVTHVEDEEVKSDIVEA